MFISDRLVFLELQKTGCTHVAKILAELLPGKQLGKHNRFSARTLDQTKAYLATIRNPWDWYLSLWAFGCDQNGSLYLRTTARGELAERLYSGEGGSGGQAPASQHAEEWLEAYSDVRNPDHFRRWLHMLHHPTTREDIGEYFAENPLSKHVGLMTFRYMWLFWRDGTHAELTKPFQPDRDDSAQCYVDHFIKNENLEQDLIDTLERIGYRLTDQHHRLIHQRERTNVSAQRDESIRYYDADSLALVAQRDRLIIDRFGYQPPAV